MLNNTFDFKILFASLVGNSFSVHPRIYFEQNYTIAYLKSVYFYVNTPCTSMSFCQLLLYLITPAEF